MNKFADIACLIIGALLPLAFAPFNAYALAWILPGLLIPLWLNTTPKHAAWRGWLFGCGFFGVGVSWVYVSIHEYGYAPVWLSVLFTFLFVAVLASFYAGFAWIFRRLFRASSLLSWCIAFPALWTLFEWLRGWIFSGFPWLYVGYTQIDSILSGFIPLVGIYGMTAITVLLSALLIYSLSLGILYLASRNTLSFNNIKPGIFTALTLALLFISAYFLKPIQWTNINNDAQKISLIQGNIPQAEKWDRQYIHSIIEKYTDLTTQHWDSSLIIWPEASLPVPLPASQLVVDSFDKAAKQHDATLIMGVLTEATDHRYYNSVLAVGEGQGQYHKQRLVPFGEYVPLESMLRGLIQFFNLPFSTIVPGDAAQPVLESGTWKIAPLICYEIAYANLAEEAARQGNILLTISNDSWFGDSLGPKQHLQIAQFRARETGRFVMRATNNGITALINPQGKIVDQIPAFTTAVLTVNTSTTSGLTPIVRIQHNNIVIVLLILFFISCGYSIRKTGTLSSTSGAASAGLRKE